MAHESADRAAPGQVASCWAMRLPAEVLAKSGRGELADLKRELKNKVRKARPWRPLGGLLAVFVIPLFLQKLGVNVSPTGFISIGLILAFCIAMALLEAATRDWILAGGKLKSLKVAAKERGAAVRLVLSGAAYALYLRDFFSEQTVMHPAIKGTTFIETPGYTENPLTVPIARHLPIVALLNKDDSYTSSYVRRVVVPSSDWFERFEGYAKHAAFVVVSGDTLTPGLHSEINWLREQGFLSKTVFSLASHLREYVEQESPWMAGESLAIIYRRRRQMPPGMFGPRRAFDMEIPFPDKVFRFVAAAARRRRRNWHVRAPKPADADVVLECLEPYLRNIPDVTTDGRDIDIVIEVE